MDGFSKLLQRGASSASVWAARPAQGPFLLQFAEQTGASAGRAPPARALAAAASKTFLDIAAEAEEADIFSILKGDPCCRVVNDRDPGS